MFVDVTGMMLRKGLSMAKAAKKYDKWKQAQVILPTGFNFRAAVRFHWCECKLLLWSPGLHSLQ